MRVLLQQEGKAACLMLCSLLNLGKVRSKLFTTAILPDYDFSHVSLCMYVQIRMMKAEHVDSISKLKCLETHLSQTQRASHRGGEWPLPVPK